MRETELKAVVPDESTCLASLLAAGAVKIGDSRLEDRRYDFPDDRLTMKDLVLRVRVNREGDRASASLDWKGAATFEAGYKHRDETTIAIDDPEGLARVLASLGLRVNRAIDRNITMLRLGEAILRIERYPRMDTLLEVEGSAPAIEDAIRASGISRDAFVADRLYQFVQRYEARTGTRAAICDDESGGDYPFRSDSA
jgi:predicted adenylyl cyclase CyaB